MGVTMRHIQIVINVQVKLVVVVWWVVHERQPPNLESWDHIRHHGREGLIWEEEVPHTVEEATLVHV